MVSSFYARGGRTQMPILSRSRWVSQYAILVMALLFFAIADVDLMGAQAKDAAESNEGIPEVAADEALRKSIQASLKVYSEELLPSQEEAREITRRYAEKIGAEQQLISKLKSADENQLEKVHREMDELSARLEVLRRVAEVITDMDPDARSEAIVKAKDTISKISAQRQADQGQAHDDMAIVQQVYAQENQPFADQFDLFFRKVGSGECSEFKRTFLNANFASSQVSSGYNNGEHSVIISLHFYPDQETSKSINATTERLGGRYPILNSSSGHLRVQAGTIGVTVYTTGKAMPAEQLGKVLENVVDLPVLTSKLSKLDARHR